MLLLVVTATQTLAIFEEQAGENDWHSESVGRFADAQPTGKDHLIVSTTSNVLAALKLKTGSILWRQVLHSSDQLQSFVVLSKPAAVVSLSNSSSLLRAWRSGDGVLLWEKRIQPSSEPRAALSALPETVVGAGEGIVVSSGGRVQARLSYDSPTHWEVQAPLTSHS